MRDQWCSSISGVPGVHQDDAGITDKKLHYLQNMWNVVYHLYDYLSFNLFCGGCFWAVD